MTTVHGLWPGPELGGTTKPDVQGSSCMANCGAQIAVVSSLPEHAQDSHGNLAEQSRPLGPSRGQETSVSKPAQLAQNLQNATVGSTSAPMPRAVNTPEKTANANAVSLAQIKPVLDKNACLACHGMATKLVGPSFKDVAARYKSQNGALALLSGKIKGGGQGVWGAIPMPAQALSPDEATQIARWLLDGMPP